MKFSFSDFLDELVISKASEIQKIKAMFQKAIRNK